MLDELVCAIFVGQDDELHPGVILLLSFVVLGCVVRNLSDLAQLFLQLSPIDVQRVLILVCLGKIDRVKYVSLGLLMRAKSRNLVVDLLAR